jgi:hypothetical protein
VLKARLSNPARKIHTGAAHLQTLNYEFFRLAPEHHMPNGPTGIIPMLAIHRTIHPKCHT